MSKTVSKVPENRIVIKNARVSYCNLWSPKESENEDGTKVMKYSCQLLISKTDKFAKENEANLNKAIEAAKEKGKTKLANKNGVVPKNIKTCKRDGDTDPTYEDEEIYKDMWVVNCSNMRQPGLIDKNREKIMNEEEIYSGMYAYVSISLSAFDSGKSKGISAYINNLMKTKDGDRLDGGIAAEKEFEAYDDVEDDDEI